MSRNVVDLTLDSNSDDDERPRKRHRPQPATGHQSDDSDVQLVDSGTSDVEMRNGQPERAVNAGEDGDLGDEDLLITGATGQVATRDLPHPRPDCADCRFTTGTSRLNSSHCPQCYCYVCDLKASECRFWGTGARERDHCNARPLGYWRRLREAARDGGNRGLIQSEYMGSGPLGAGLPPRAPQVQTRIPFPTAPNAGNSTSLMAGLERLRFAVEAALGAEAAGGARGDSTEPASGIGHRPGPSAPAATPETRPAAEARGAAAEPSRAQAATPAQANAAAAVQKTPPTAVKLPTGICSLRRLPDPSTDRNAFELGVLRFGVKTTRGFTVAEIASRLERLGFYFDITRNKPEHYGERFALDNIFETKYTSNKGVFKNKALYLKLLPLPAPPEEMIPLSTERVRKVLVVDCLGRTRATYMGVRVQHKVKRAEFLAALAPMLRPLFSPVGEVLHLITSDGLEGDYWRVVDAEASLDDDFFRGTCTESKGRQIVIFRTAHHPEPRSQARGESSSSGQQVPEAQMPIYNHSTSPHIPAWMLVHLRQFKAPGVVDDGPDRFYTTMRLGVPFLIPLRKNHAKGGREAMKDFTAAFMQAMQPYRVRTVSTSPPVQPEVVLRGNANHLTVRLDQVCSNERWSNTGTSSIYYSFNPSVLSALTAIMPRDLPSTSYRVEDLRNIAVDTTATPEALRETERLVSAVKAREASLGRRKTLPSQCIQELVRASRRVHHEDKVSSSMHDGDKCSVALEVTLQPSTKPGASPREGELIIKVYTWNTDSHGRATLFSPWDEWSSLGKRDHSGCVLRTTTMLLATGATDKDERVLREAADRALQPSGPSTSSARPLEVGGGAALLQRVRAERKRAERMFSNVLALEKERPYSIEGLMQFMQSGEQPAAEQPPGLSVTMRPYQLQSLAFMMNLERLVDDPQADADASASGPSTSNATAPLERQGIDASDTDGPGGYRRVFWVPISNSKGQRYWYSPVFERLSREVPPQPVGGFLAEEMGLGKTVEVMALILANPPPQSVKSGTVLPCGRIQSRATLVVCAVSLVGQWQAEAQNKTVDSCRIHPYHGPSRIRDAARLATEFDVVVTTYQTLQADHAAGGRDPCQAIKWHRIVFDEGHMLKNAGAKMSKAAVELVADRKWLCTGTPINNSVEDLLGQFNALHMVPLSKKTYFDSYIKCPFLGSRVYSSNTVLPLLYAIRHTMIRHTKAQNLGGQDVLQLPEKTETDIPVILSAEEQALYLKVHKEARKGWEKLKSVGSRYVNSHLFTATSMLMPLRRICSGGLLKPADLVVPDPERLAAVGAAVGAAGGAGGAEAQEVVVPEDISECPICVDTMEQPVATPCNHWFCKECIMGWINSSAHHNCPACRQPVTAAGLRKGVRQQATPEAEDEDDQEAEDGAMPCESKLRILLAELREMRDADPTAKALVFTQFSQTLEWLKPRLLEEGFGHRTITGDMTQKKRNEAIDSFQRDPDTNVFLLSVRSGAVGINLTAANYIFLLEPCMNPAMEEQAIGRAWRMGQQRAVVIKRLYVKGSVEERIMEVVKARRVQSGAGGQAAGLDAGGAAAGTANGSRAGSLRQDKTDLRISELDLMFRDPVFPPHTATA